VIRGSKRKRRAFKASGTESASVDFTALRAALATRSNTQRSS
jgi:hypothetical protein